MWQYLGPDERRHVLDGLAALGATATPRRPLAHVSFEPADAPGGGRHAVRLRVWPGGGRTAVLGHAPAHGVPVTWHDDG
jgi:hypothetical protein